MNVKYEDKSSLRREIKKIDNDTDDRKKFLEVMVRIIILILIARE